MYFIQSIIIISAQYLRCTNFALANLLLKSVEVILKKTKSSVRIFVFTSAFSWWARICAMCSHIFLLEFLQTQNFQRTKKTDENFQFERICLFDFILLLIQIKLNCQSFFLLFLLVPTSFSELPAFFLLVSYYRDDNYAHSCHFVSCNFFLFICVCFEFVVIKNKFVFVEKYAEDQGMKIPLFMEHLLVVGASETNK